MQCATPILSQNQKDDATTHHAIHRKQRNNQHSMTMLRRRPSYDTNPRARAQEARGGGAEWVAAKLAAHTDRLARQNELQRSSIRPSANADKT